jgi:hypothetical protein
MAPHRSRRGALRKLNDEGPAYDRAKRADVFSSAVFGANGAHCFSGVVSEVLSATGHNELRRQQCYFAARP